MFITFIAGANTDLPALHGHRDHDEDAAAVGEMTETLKDGEGEFCVVGVGGEFQVVRQHHQVGAEEENVGPAETGEEIIKHAGRQSEHREYNTNILDIV